MVNVSIKFSCPEDMTFFVNAINKVSSDVDIKNGSVIFDAKSAQCVYALPLNKELICSTHESSEEQLRAAIGKLIIN